MKALYEITRPISKLCAPETILGSDSISYALASQVDMYEKLQISEQAIAKIAVEHAV